MPRPDETVPAGGSLGRRVALVLLVLLMLGGFCLRMEDLDPWRANADATFFRGEPILTALDGYKYLCYARDLAEGTYDPIEQRRNFPQSVPRPRVPPPISVMVWLVSALLGVSLNWAATVLPPLLGISLAIPVYLLGTRIMSRGTGLIAAGLCLSSPHYIGRSGLGHLDTDCLNVTLLALICFAFAIFATSKRARSYLGLVAGIVLSVLFALWWDVAKEIALLLTGVALIPAIGLHLGFRSKAFWMLLVGLAGLFLAGLAVLPALGVVFQDGQTPAMYLWNRIQDFYGHVTKSHLGASPNIAESIAELVRPSLRQVSLWTTGSHFSFGLSVVGLVWLLRARFKYMLVLFPLLGLSLAALLFGGRFLIFLNPLLGLGLSFLVVSGWRFRSRFAPLKWILPLLLTIHAVNLFVVNERLVQWPIAHSRVVAGLDAIAHSTPTNSVVWTLWDNGHLANYWSRRATVADGGIHSGGRVVLASIPFAAQSPRLAANFMRFYARYGEKGVWAIARSLGGYGAGVAWLRERLDSNQWDPKCFEISPIPDPRHAALSALAKCTTYEARPLYIVLDQRLAATWPSWLTHGNWCFPGTLHPIDEQTLKTSQFHRMFDEGRYDPKYFRLLLDDHPFVQVWFVLPVPEPTGSQTDR